MDVADHLKRHEYTICCLKKIMPLPEVTIAAGYEGWAGRYGLNMPYLHTLMFNRVWK